MHCKTTGETVRFEGPELESLKLKWVSVCFKKFLVCVRTCVIGVCNSKLEIGHYFSAFLNVCNRVCTSIFPKNCEACLPSCLDRSQQTIKKKKEFLY